MWPFTNKNDSARKQKFTEYFARNTFGSKESVSGQGSTMIQTAGIRKMLPILFQQFGIKKIVDAPCGDFHWMQHTDLSNIESYMGLDIVEEIVRTNNKKYKTDKISFAVKDICTDPLPAADLILCRDCLVHLSFEDANKFIKNLKNADIKYLLVTTFPARVENRDLNNLIWRTLDMELAPFHFPKPIFLLNEGCTEDDNIYTDKSLGLFAISEINHSKDKAFL